MTQKEYALIVAGGKGTRFRSSTPKQFLELNGKPVLLHTLEAFYRYKAEIEIALILPEEDLGAWKEICKAHHFENTVLVRPGGATRFQSVKKGLEMIGDGFVAIHDGVRPLVTTEIIETSFRLAKTHQSAVASVAFKDSIRMMDPPESGTKGPSLVHTRAVDRSLFRAIQTPQTFNTSLIKEAYDIQEDPFLTDDASIFERAGFSVHLFEGSYRNIKITTPEDLLIAEALLQEPSGL